MRYTADEFHAIFTNEVIRAIGSLARQREVCREQDGKAVFVTGMDAAREYIICQFAARAIVAETIRTEPEGEKR